MTDPTQSLATPYRSHTCGQLRTAEAGSSARLSGWVHRRRDLGHLIFLELRDRHGITQVVIDKSDAPAAHEQASRIRHGQSVNLAELSRAPLVKVFYGQRDLIAIATRIAGSLFHAKIVFSAG